MAELTAAEITRMQTDLAAFLPDSAVISRYTLARDSMGGGSATYSAAGTVACRISPRSQNPRAGAVGSRLAERAQWIVTLPANTDVTVYDRVVTSSRTLEVAEVDQRSWELGRVCLCVETT